jgi:four helix bundle protein
MGDGKEEELVQNPKSKVQSPIWNIPPITGGITVAKIEKFEDIQAWKLARELSNLIYEVTSVGKFDRDFVLKDQIRRAAISIISNIAEGFERGGDKEFLQFLAVAKGSSGELRAQLYVALDQRYVAEREFKLLSEKVTELSRLLAGFIKYLQRSEMRGSKYR